MLMAEIKQGQQMLKRMQRNWPSLLWKQWHRSSKSWTAVLHLLYQLVFFPQLRDQISNGSNLEEKANFGSQFEGISLSQGRQVQEAVHISASQETQFSLFFLLLFILSWPAEMELHTRRVNICPPPLALTFSENTLSGAPKGEPHKCCAQAGDPKEPSHYLPYHRATAYPGREKRLPVLGFCH